MYIYHYLAAGHVTLLSHKDWNLSGTGSIQHGNSAITVTGTATSPAFHIPCVGFPAPPFPLPPRGIQEYVLL